MSWLRLLLGLLCMQAGFAENARPLAILEGQVHAVPQSVVDYEFRLSVPGGLVVLPVSVVSIDAAGVETERLLALVRSHALPNVGARLRLRTDEERGLVMTLGKNNRYEVADIEFEYYDLGTKSTKWLSARALSLRFGKKSE